MTMEEIKGRKVAIDIVKANVFAVVIMVVAAVVFLVPFFLIWKDRKPISELLGGLLHIITIYQIAFNTKNHILSSNHVIFGTLFFR